MPIIVLYAIIVLLAILIIILLVNRARMRSDSRQAEELIKNNKEKIHNLEQQINAFKKREADIVKRERDAELKASALLSSANGEASRKIDEAVAEAKARHDTIMKSITESVKAEKTAADAMLEQARIVMVKAIEYGDTIVKHSRDEAAKLSQSVLNAVEHENNLEEAIKSLEARFTALSDNYIVPASVLLEELNIDYSFSEAGKMYKAATDARLRIAQQDNVITMTAVTADVRSSIKALVLGSFDSQCMQIVAASKSKNFGLLQEKINGLFAQTNEYARQFHNAKISKRYLDAWVSELKWLSSVYEIKKQSQEEQRAIREQIREEERARKEFEKAQKEAAKEKATYEKLLTQAMEQAAKASEGKKAEFEAKVLDLQAKLKEAEEKNQRAQSMAQQTKKGNVYVISNIGSFGENVYKIGMTRRLDPIDRVRELGDASVPFSFDVHAILSSDDAPALETDLHHKFMDNQVNKVNPRKEFFRVDISEVKKYVENKVIKAIWTIQAEAEQYRESLRIEEMIKGDDVARVQWEKNNTAIPADMIDDGDLALAS